MLTPMQIQNHEFKKGFRGYNEEDVQDFMRQIADDYQVLFRDNREMKETIEQLRKQVEECKQREDTAIRTLMVAQETAESVKEVARKEAEVIVREAQQQKRNMIAQTAQQIREGQEKYEAIRAQLAVSRAKIEALLSAQAELLKGMDLPELEQIKAEEVVENIAEEAVVEEEMQIIEEAPVASEVAEEIQEESTEEATEEAQEESEAVE